MGLRLSDALAGRTPLSYIASRRARGRATAEAAFKKVQKAQSGATVTIKF